jgi:hypothetical protein
MAKVKTYWDEIKNDEFFLYGGNWGWEIHFRFENVGRWDPKTGEHKYTKSLQPQWPFGYGSEKVPREEKALCKKEVMQQYKQRKMLAQASRNKEEYRDLHSRINNERWEDIVATGLKGFNLGQYIRSKYLTEREAYALFYNM